MWCVGWGRDEGCWWDVGSPPPCEHGWGGASLTEQQPGLPWGTGAGEGRGSRQQGASCLCQSGDSREPHHHPPPTPHSAPARTRRGHSAPVHVSGHGPEVFRVLYCVNNRKREISPCVRDTQGAISISLTVSVARHLESSLPGWSASLAPRRHPSHVPPKREGNLQQNAFVLEGSSAAHVKTHFCVT